MLGVVMIPAAWDQVRGRSVDAAMDRTQSAFIQRAAFEGCEDPVVSTVSIDETHKTHYGAEYPTARSFAARFERCLRRHYEGRFFERVEVRNAGDMEVVSFPGGGQGCYDNAFVPIVVELDLGWGVESSFPLAFRITQAHQGLFPIPFLADELTGLHHDEKLPAGRRRGGVDEMGWVPPAFAP